MHVDFVFWKGQCPWECVMRERLAEARRLQPKLTVGFMDVTNDFLAAKTVRMFEPLLLIFSNGFRIAGPQSSEELVRFASGETTTKRHHFDFSSKGAEGNLIPLTTTTAHRMGEACHCTHLTAGNEKSRWVETLLTRHRLPHLGFLHEVEGLCRGGAEFVPSLEVPYDISRSPNAAFLTCLFATSPDADFRSRPLQAVERECGNLGFTELLTLASEEVLNPNGPLWWFQERDYEDLGLVAHEPSESARIHLLRKSL